jgi:basic membrane lipoprotein Med (substrate-binding protein (PBP1-ABC) superfamily)
MKAGGNDIVFTASEVPSDVVAKMETKRAAIKAGTFTVPVNPKEPA